MMPFFCYNKNDYCDHSDNCDGSKSPAKPSVISCTMMGDRLLKTKERNQRGCQFCEDSNHNGWMCPYDACPYTEMDGFTKYKDYLKSVGGASASELIRTVEGSKTK